MAVWSKVRFSDTPNDMRIDSEYYEPEYLLQADSITSIPTEALENLAQVSDGNHISISEKFCDSGVRYLRGQDLNDFFISDSDPIYIPEEEYKCLKRSHMHCGDILIGIVGTIGSVGLVTDKYGPLTGNCKLAIVRPKTLEPEYLAAFFLSRIGQNEIKRRIRGTIQKGLILPDLKEIPIPLVVKYKRLEIVKIIQSANKKRKLSINLLSQAESLLLSEINLNNLDLSSSLFYKRSFSETKKASRCDADFFQPKYYRLIEQLNTCSFPKYSLKNLIEPIINGYDFREFSEKGLPYIRVGDVSNGRIERDSAMRVDIQWEDINKDVKLKVGDVLMTRKGSYGNAAFVREGQEDGIISSEVMLLRPKKDSILPEYLTVFLNSVAGFNQVERYVHGVAFYSISQKDLASVRIVVPPMKLQKEIAIMINRSDKEHKKYLSLIEEAKTMIEELVFGGSS